LDYYIEKTLVIPMVKLNAEMKETFGKVKLFPVATASKGGVPNVAPIAFVILVSDDTIWLNPGKDEKKTLLIL